VAKYNRKPDTIEAFQMGIDNEPDWFKQAILDGHASKELDKNHEKFYPKPLAILIKRPNPHSVRSTTIAVSKGTWIILAKEGYLVRMSSSDFEERYELSKPYF
jgi:hypothetical protein